MMRMMCRRIRIQSIFYIILTLIALKILYKAIGDDPELSSPHQVLRMFQKKKSTRPTEYCNSLEHINSGQEGEHSEGFTLESVHVLVRHGARTSIQKLPGIEPPSVSCEIDDHHSNMTQYLRNIKDIWARSNSKFGFAGWQLHPTGKRCKGSALTSFGMKQHVSTGKYFKLKYGHKINMTRVLIRSTAVQRTFQSAVAILLGMLSRKDLENVRIFKSGQLSLCSETMFSESCKCPGADKLLGEAMKQAGQVERKNPGRLKLINEFRKMLGTEITDDFMIVHSIDVFMTFECHNISLPCVGNNKCFDNSHLEMMWEVQDELGKMKALENKNIVQHAHLYMHPLLTEIANRITNMTRRRRTTESFVLYSGHDINITPLAIVLGIYYGKWPPFASRIVIELYKNIEKKFHYFIKILFNGKDVTPDVSFCKNKILKGYCKLKYFLDFVDNHLNDIGLTSYTHGCHGI